ncbi:hypothetical protein C8J57DRAFT_1211391 [Mycena rebaudengoi]|nr:hypothetical protein C8J57DRAFT_1211391 [Mycena rebaudengoi]
MEPSAHQRFLASNIVWPPGNRFFLPDGGLICFLRENIRFKVFLLVMPVFTNVVPARSGALQPVNAHERVGAPYAQIRQNEFRISYDPVPVPSEAAWMFHVILCLLQVIRFKNDMDMSLKTNQPFQTGTTEGQLAEAQAKFLLGMALQTYVDNVCAGAHSPLDYKTYDEYGWVNKNFVHRIRLDVFKAMPVGIPFQESLEIEDILRSFPMLKEVEAIVRQEWEEEEMTCATIVASTVQSIAMEMQEATGWVTMEELDRPLDEYFNRPFPETARFPRCDGIQVTLLTSHCRQGLLRSFDEGYYSGDEDEATMAAVYAAQKARGCFHPQFCLQTEMPPLPVSELEQLFEPLTMDPQLLHNPLWTPVNGLEPFLRYCVCKMVYLLTASVCDEGGLETPMPIMLEAELELIQSGDYFQNLSSSFILPFLLSVSLQRTVGQRTFADQIGALYASDLLQQLPETTFDFPPCVVSMINILVQICDRVKLPDPANQAVLIPMLQML